MMIFRCALILAIVLGISALPLRAAEPEIRNLNVRGLQVGGTTTLVLDGDDFGTTPRLLLPFAAKQTLKTGSTAKQATFEVTLPDSVIPGYHQLRVVSDSGVSLPVVVGVDRLAQRPLTATTESIPVALHGVIGGSTVVETTFAGKAGQKVIVEVEAQRMGSKLRSVLHLYAPKHRQITWSWGTAALSGDTRLETTLPTDGEYTVALHDAEYATPGPGFFRLKIGEWSYVDAIFPPVVGKDQKSVELLGSSSAQVDIPATRDGHRTILPWPKEGTWSGPRPFVRLSPRTEILAQTAEGKVQDLPAGALGVSGRLLTRFAEDRYRIPVTPKSKIRLEVFAERLGSPIDVSLIVRNDLGVEVARAGESPGSLDPVLEYAVPDKVTTVQIGVLDAQGRGGRRGIYRLTVDPVPPTAPKNDFLLFTPVSRISLPAGGKIVVPVLAERRGYQGSITLSADGLPAGTKLDNATIPPGAEGTLVTVPGGAGITDAVVFSWRGRSEDGRVETVSIKGHALERMQPWLAEEVALAPVAAKGTPFEIDWRGLPPEAGIIPVAKLALPIKVTRPVSDAVVRLSLLTSQVQPLVNNQPDPNRALRVEKPVELAAKVNEGEITVLVPAELPSPVYDVAVQADLLSADRKTVLATAFTPVRRMAVRLPIALTLDGPARIEVKRDPKTGVTFEIVGKIERKEGFTGDVTITLTGLPAPGTAPAITVKTGETRFAIKVVLPATFPTGELTGLILNGSVVPDAKQPNLRVRSRDVGLSFVVNADGK